MTISEHRRALDGGEWTVVDGVERALVAMDRHDPEDGGGAGDGGSPGLNAMTQRFRAEALVRAAELDERLRGMRARGERAPALFGVPVAIKDNICTRLGRTTCASRMLEGYRSPFDATAVSRLLDAGAVIVGKTNLDEFAMGSSGEHSAFGVTRNPWDRTRVCGGSSSGSAAAVAAGLVPVALGSDTGGSVRQPAALTGIVGLKPTYGRVSRWGLVAFASSLDQIGMMTRTVEDAAEVLDAVAGVDPLDSTSVDRGGVGSAEAVRAVEAAGGDVLRGMTVAVLEHHPSLDADMGAALDRAAEIARGAGASVRVVTLPQLEHAIAVYYIIATAEASSNLARYDGVRYGHRCSENGEGRGGGMTLEEMYERSRTEGFGGEVRRRLLLGTYVLSAGYYDAYYLRALKVRRLIRDAFARVFEDADALLMPATPGSAFRIGEKDSDPLSLYLEDYYTVTANLAGVPSVSVPVGMVAREGSTMPAGLPVGVQVAGRWFDEAGMLRVARVVERGAGFSGLSLE